MSVKWPSKCRRAKQVDLLVTGALSAEEAAQVEQHVAGCLACRGHRAELTTLTGKLAALLPAEVSPRLGFEARWRRAVAEARPPRWQRFTARRSRSQRSADSLVRAKASLRPEHADKAVRAPEESPCVVRILTDSSAEGRSARLWRFVREQRRGLAALGAAWMLIGFLRFDAPSVAPEPGAATPVVSWREFVASMKMPEQTLRHLAEATEPGALPLKPARTPRSALPALRNEASFENEGGFYERNSSVAIAA